MKRILAHGLVLAAAVGCSDQLTSPANAGLRGPIQPTFARSASAGIPGRYIVVLKSATGDVDSEASSLSRRHGGTIRRVYKSALRGLTLDVPDAEVAALRAEPNVAYVEQDQTMSATGTETGADWGLDRMDQRMLPLDGSYTYQSDGTGVTAYIIDTGINFTHAEFGGRASAGIDEITAGGTAADCNGHGTHVSGTVGGTTYGVAKNVRLVAVRVLDCSGSGSTSGVIAGVDWVTANRVLPAVANVSLGGGFSQALNDAIERSIAAGVAYAIAAGNSTADACTTSPASAPDAITVGATDNTDTFASFSNYGSCVRINAPGVGITSAWIGSNTATAAASGTSMASPHVAGAAALYLQTNPGASPAQVRAALTGAATSNVIQAIGSGTPNLLLYTAPGTAPTPSPSGAQLSENWSSNAIGSNWVYTHTGAGAASASSGALTLGSNGAGDATATVTTASAYSLDAAGSAGVVFKLASTSTTRDNTVMLVDANGNGFGLYFGANGYLVPGDVIGSVVREGTYVAHAIPGYVRFRKSGTNYVVDTSPDGTTWTVQRSAPLVANTVTGAMKLQFTASGYGASGSWSASYDDITWAGSSVAPAAPPVARMSTSCSALSCNYDGSASTAAGGASYAWAFGDGATGSGVTASHAYAAAGSYTVTLTVTDANGANSTSQSVAVSSVTAQLTESWSSNTIGSNWVYTHSGAGAASAASGALTLGSNAAGDASATVTTASAYSLDAAGSAGVVFKLASTATTRDNTALLVDANGNGFGFYFGPNGYLVIGDVTGGFVREGTYVRNAIPGYVRFRMSGTNYVVDTSPDGTTWTVQRSSPLVANTVTGAMKLQFTASGYGTSGSWSASYDDITWK